MKNSHFYLTLLATFTRLIRISYFHRLFSLVGRVNGLERAEGCVRWIRKSRKNEKTKRETELEARKKKEIRIQMLMKLTRRALIWPLQLFDKRLKANI